MTNKLLIAVLIYAILGFKNQPNKCELIPNKGVNNLFIGETTLKEVKKEYGKKFTRHKWIFSDETEVFGRFEYFVKENGIKFSTRMKDRNKTIIYRIVLSSNCDCKTINGIGIGSSYNDVIDEFKSAGELSHWDSYGYKGEKVIELSYDNMYVIFDGNNKATSKVVQIIIESAGPNPACHLPNK
ncbi:MAG: hypothetical protein HRT71_17100 [Flavobacteriales bacterium]|nr:hypothetical protein [Flavobacteriales bacterium]